MWVQSPGGEDPVEEGMTTHPVCLPEESHGQKSLAGHSPQSHKESDTTKRLSPYTNSEAYRLKATYQMSNKPDENPATEAVFTFPHLLILLPLRLPTQMPASGSFVVR